MPKRKQYVEIKVRLKTEAQKARLAAAATKANQSLSKWMLTMAERGLAS